MPRTKQMPAIRNEAITLSLLTSDLDWAIRSPEYTPTETSPSDRDSTRTTIAVLPPVNYIHFGRRRCPECGEDTEHLFVTLKDGFVSYAHA